MSKSSNEHRSWLQQVVQLKWMQLSSSKLHMKATFICSAALLAILAPGQQFYKTERWLNENQ
jgi:hypothetical protein